MATEYVRQLVMDELVSNLKQRQEWDQPPELYMIYADETMAYLRPMAMSDNIWMQAPPHQVLSAYAAVMRESRPDDLEVPDEAYGIALFDEVLATANCKTAAEALLAKQYDARIISAVGRDGHSFIVGWRRDEPEPDMTVDCADIGGAIFEAIDELMDAIFQVKPPPRPEPSAGHPRNKANWN